MQFDGIAMRACLAEASRRLLGARLQRVLQVSPLAIALELWAGSTAYLVCSAEAEAACIFVANGKPARTEEPSPFVSLLRRHLLGTRFESARQSGWDRVATLDFRGRNELGDPLTLSLMVETMGKHSNLICVRTDGRILDAAKRVGRSRSRVRQVLPGLPYQHPPSPAKRSPDAVDSAAIGQLLGAPSGVLPLRHAVTALVGGVAGLGPERAKQLLRAPYAEHGGDVTGSNGLEPLLGAVAASVRAAAADADAQAATSSGASACKDVEAAFWEALDQHHSGHGVAAPGPALAANGRQRALADQVARAAAKARDLATATRAKLAELDLDDGTRARAEAIMSSLAELRRMVSAAAAKGHSELQVELPTYGLDTPDAQGTVAIELRTGTDPVTQAQELFAAYAAANRRRQALSEVLGEAEVRANRLATLAFQLEGEITPDELAEIAAEAESMGTGQRNMAEVGPGRKPGARRRKGTEAGAGEASRPRRSESPGGFEVLVGRNNRQNDAIVRMARGEDLWFHTRGVPGAHVLLRVGGRGTPPPAADIMYAAGLAALHSQARGSGSVAVDYCPAKHLRKEKGAAPGFVTYSAETTLHVAPHVEGGPRPQA